MMRGRLLAVMDVVLRVPPVFLVDSIFMSGFADWSKLLPQTSSSSPDAETPSSSSLLGENASTFLNGTIGDSSDGVISASSLSQSGTTDADVLWQTLIFFMYMSTIFASIAVFLLPIRTLLNLYLWMLSVALVLWSYVSNESYVIFMSGLSRTSLAYELFQFQDWDVWYRLICNYFLQVFLSLSFCYLSSHVHRQSDSLISKRIVGVSFIIPTIISLLPGSLPSTSKSWISLFADQHLYDSNDTLYKRIRALSLALSPITALSLSLFYIMATLAFRAKAIISVIVNDIQWSRTIIRHYGVYTLIENQWSRLHVPQVLRVFWLTRLVEQALMMIAESETSADFNESGLLRITIDPAVVYATAKALVVRGCETMIAVLGMTSVLSSISHQVGCGIQWFLAVEDPEDRNIGTVSAMLFFILALQTGITGMEPEKRLQRLYRNICLLFTAILHFVHNMVNPLLNSLSASRNMSVQRHARALAVCLFLIAFPAWFLFFLWRNEGMVSTWLLAVSAFSIEVIIKVIISLLIYTLFMVDAFRATLWEPLDDYVYYIKASGNTIEFLFGIFLFFNGAWILLFESGGTIRALMMCIHAYFNIWLQAKQGWQKFIRRRQAVDKINSLPEARADQLQEFDDVCAICYQEMASARITRCNHYFHAVCLRKWLYVQDICPLCHDVLYVEAEVIQQQDNNNDVPAEAQQPPAAAAAHVPPAEPEREAAPDAQPEQAVEEPESSSSTEPSGSSGNESTP